MGGSAVGVRVQSGCRAGLPLCPPHWPERVRARFDPPAWLAASQGRPHFRNLDLHTSHIVSDTQGLLHSDLQIGCPCYNLIKSSSWVSHSHSFRSSLKCHLLRNALPKPTVRRNPPSPLCTLFSSFFFSITLILT